MKEIFNLYRQQLHSSQQEFEKKKKSFPKLAILYKQILSDCSGHSSSIEAYKTDREMLYELERLRNQFANKNTGCPIYNLKKLLEDIDSFDRHTIFIKSESLAEISKFLFGTWNTTRIALGEYANFLFREATKDEKIILKKQKEDFLENSGQMVFLKASDLKKYRERFIKADTFSIHDLETALYRYSQTHQDDMEGVKETGLITSYFKSFTQKINNSKVNIFNQLNEARSKIKDIVELKELSTNRNKDAKGFEQVETIKFYLDSLMNIIHFARPLHLYKGQKKIDSEGVDSEFYADFDFFYNELLDVITTYNKTRNFLTKKPYSNTKFKVNFKNPTLLAGWDVNKEKDNSGILLKKDDLYYLGIMAQGHSKNFDTGTKNSSSKNDDYQKLIYKLLPGASKMLPKVFFSDKNIDVYNPSNKVLSIRNHASHTKNGTPQKGYKKKDFNLSDCHIMINFFKSSILKHPEWVNFGFKFKDTKDYEDISEFYKEVEHQGYSVRFQSISREYIQKKIASNQLYLFQIYNKDFSPHSRGRANLHTLYWRGLFDTENSKNTCLKLNGEAEVFYRHRSIKKADQVVHKANSPVQNKNPKNPKKESQFEYDIIKDKRFTQSKLFLHVPVTLNFKAEASGKYGQFNEAVNQKLKNDLSVNIIGIDRGERNLLYYTVINQRGGILEQGSLNSIKTHYKNKKNEFVEVETSYHDLLDKKEKERDLARKSWSTIENIKELKSGYLAQIVHKLAQLMIQHNAIVVLEDLNFGFKKGRFKVEKQIYQKFEKALIDKLNYLVFKDRKGGVVGSFRKAYQLTAQFQSFKKLGKQSGFLFYMPAYHTSKIDPTTGFINLVNLKYQNKEHASDFISKLESIKYNKEADHFEFDMDYKKLSDRECGPKTRWLICTHGATRYRYVPQDQKMESVDVTGQLKDLLNGAGINYMDGENLASQVLKQNDAAFFKSLLSLLNLTMTLRHSNSQKGEDFILSPIRNKTGGFYDSSVVENEHESSLPQNADANGAYHIALKGAWTLRQIHDRADGAKLKLAMSNKDWFKFVQRKEYLSTPLPEEQKLKVMKGSAKGLSTPSTIGNTPQSDIQPVLKMENKK